MHPNQPSRGGVLGCIPLDVAVFAAFALTRTHAVLRVQCTVLTPSCRRKHNAGFWRRAEDVAEAFAGGELIDAGQALAAAMRSDRPDGLLATVVEEEGGVALGLAYSPMGPAS